MFTDRGCIRGSQINHVVSFYSISRN